MNRILDLWNKCLTIIKDNITESAFTTWFKPIVALQCDNNEVVLQLPSMFFYEYIEEKYSNLLRATVDKIAGEEASITYRVLMDSDSCTTSDLPTAKKAQPQIKKPQPFSPFENVVSVNFESQLNPHYYFDNFIEGKSNKLARSAALSIVQNSDKTIFNPLFIFGNSGTGKTHLCNAIGNEAKRNFPQKRILFIAANLFQIQYTDAVRNNNTNDFLNFYQSLDMLIIDDIHEFVSKTGTQNTFFHIFNHLHRLGKQIILTCDRQPSELKGMEERLITRFRWGLTAEIEKPDLELRRNILKYKIKQDGWAISDEIIEFIAENVTENVRDLEGIWVSLMAHSIINGDEITLDLAKKMIGYTPKEPKKINVDYICDLVCNHYSLSNEVLFSKTRKREIALPRQVAMYLARKHTEYSLDTIADTMGKRTHATVLHSYKLIENLLPIDKNLKRDIEILEGKIK